MATTTQVLGKVGLVDKGVYDVNAEYSRLDFVTDENNISTYISLVNNNQGHSLEDPEYWRYLAKGKANTPAEVLDLLLQADGPGSGLDADTLDGTELSGIVNPEAVAAASPFDFFLGAKQVDGQWVFQKMSPANVASVVAGLMGFKLEQSFIPRTGLSNNSNLDNVTTVGMYRISGGATNCPVINGFLLVFFQNSTCLQFCVSSTASELYMRIRWTTSWFDWVKVNG